jgi:Predicted ATPase
MGMTEAGVVTARGRTAGKRTTPHLVVPFGPPVRLQADAVRFDSRSATNGHMLIAGPSGTGKTHQVNRIIRSLAEQGAKQIFVLNVHGDLCEGFPEELVHRVVFSEVSEYGLSPLDVLQDPEIGGVRRRANSFISLLQRQGALGPKQQTALFRLLVDLYARHGFLIDDPKTWSLDHDPRHSRARPVIAREGHHALPGLDWFNKTDGEKARIRREYEVSFNGDSRKWEVPDNHPRAAEALELWGGQTGKRHPTLADLQRHLWDRLVAMKTGQSTRSVRALEKVMSLAAKRARLRGRKLKASEAEELDKLEAQLAAARDEALGAFETAMAEVDSGREIDELILWDSADAIKSLYDRIEALQRAGIFRGHPPPFDEGVPIWDYDIKALSDDEKQLFVDTLLERIFIEAKARGEALGPDTWIVIDEAHLFVTPDGDHIVNRLVKEARKYGIGLIMASQAFVHFSDDLLMSAATKLVLGCPEMYQEPMRRKLGLDMIEYKGKKYNPLRFLKPQQTALVSVATRGESKPMIEVRIAA